MDRSERVIPDDELRSVKSLLSAGRWAALATIADDGYPLASMVAYVPWQGFHCYLLHLSRLSRHTRNLLLKPQASLVVSELDPGTGDPQVLARVSLTGHTDVVPREAAQYPTARSAFLQRLPSAAPLFGFADFVLLTFTVERGHYVGGFARAFELRPEDLARMGEI